MSDALTEDDLMGAYKRLRSRNYTELEVVRTILRLPLQRIADLQRQLDYQDENIVILVRERNSLAQQLAEAQSKTALHKSVRQLANDMQYKLDKNSHKNTGWCGDGVTRKDQGWLPPECPLEFLIKKYHEEIGEFMELLVKACLDGDVDPMDLRYESADVANLVMMMRDSVLVMIGAAIDREGGEG